MTTYQKQIDKLLEVCRSIDAQRWLSIPGARLTQSYWSTPVNPSFEGMIEGLKILGIDYHKLPKATKWYEFWKDEKQIRMHKAIEMINV